MSATSYVFQITPMNCKSCEQKIKEVLRQASSPFKFLSVETDSRTKSLHLVLADKVNEADLSAWLSRVLADRTVVAKQQWLRFSHLQSAVLALLLGLLFLGLPYFSLPALPSVLCGIGLLLWNAWPFIQSARQQWKTRPRLNMDSLFVLTAVIVMLSSMASLWSPLFSMSLEAGFFIFGFRHLGLEFLAYLDQKMGFNQSLVQRFRHQAYGVQDGREKRAEDLALGDKIILQPGDILPVDARIEKREAGATLVDHLQNGAYLPQELQIGQMLYAGSMLASGKLQVVVEKQLYQSRLQQIDEVVLQFQSKDKKAKILQKTEAWLQWFIPGLLFFALVLGLVLTQFYSLGFAIQAVTAILVSACPCTLGLIIPMAMRMGAYKASQYDLHFKSSQALEFAALTQVVVLDFNGSLTEGQYELDDFVAVTEEAKVIIKAFETQMLQLHPGQLIGQTIADYVKTAAEMELQNFSWCKGGATAYTASGQWWFGHTEILADLHLPQIPMAAHHYYLVFQACGESAKKIVAQFRLQDKLRPGAKALVQHLKQQGKMVRICTGADVSTTGEMIQALGIEAHEIESNCSLDKKPEYIEKLRQNYPGKCIAMLGDGLNDQAAMAAADLKLWVRHPRLAQPYQAAMQDLADLELTGEHIQDLGLAFTIAEQTYDLIYQNLILSFMYNFAILSLACGMLCLLPPALGVCFMILQSALLSLNTYRVLLQPLQEQEKSAKMQDTVLQTQIS